jgi:hypothetical protein
MFAPYCERHGSRILLTTESITALVSTDHGIVVHFVCSCGASGVWSPAPETSVHPV